MAAAVGLATANGFGPNMFGTEIGAVVWCAVVSGIGNGSPGLGWLIEVLQGKINYTALFGEEHTVWHFLQNGLGKTSTAEQIVELKAPTCHPNWIEAGSHFNEIMPIGWRYNPENRRFALQIDANAVFATA